LAGALFGLGLERIISVELALPQVTFFVAPGSAVLLWMSHSLMDVHPSTNITDR
jgi:hypothetical protein